MEGVSVAEREDRASGQRKPLGEKCLGGSHSSPPSGFQREVPAQGWGRLSKSQLELGAFSMA